MRILFVVPYAPRPIRTRPYYLLRALASRGHQVTLATLWQSEEERRALAEWKGLGIALVAFPLTRARSMWNCLRALPGSAPLQARYSWQPELAHTIDRLLVSARPPFDVIHVEHLRGSSYGLHVRNGVAPVVWDSVDCISLLFEQTAKQSASTFGRFIANLDLQRTRAYEPWLAKQFARVLITSPADKAALERLSGSGASDHVVVMANGVDLNYFQPGAATREAADIIFSGRMSYHANVSAAVFFARQVMPLIWERQPQTTFTISGYDPVPEVRMLANDPRIIVTGTVDDVRPYLQRAAVAVAPMPYGTGIQNKILEAMACQTPVVTSPQPLAALQAIAGEDVLVASSAADFARQVLSLLGDAGLRQRVAAAGRRYVEQNHNWNSIVDQLERIYADAIAGRGEARHG